MIINRSRLHISECNICGGKSVRKTSNSEIYGREYGNGVCFICDDCGACVGAHDDGRSLGILADSDMRRKKRICHELFDPIWKSKIEKRRKLYEKLASRMGIHRMECHFGWFDHKHLDLAIGILSDPNWYVEEVK